MALARVQYEQTVVGNTQFIITFPYISTDHVKVSVDGVATTYSWINTSTISLTEAPAVGSIIDIVRETERVDPLVDFNDGSTITESQLDLAAKQVFFLAQEAFDLTGSTMAVANDGSYSASLRRISLLGYPDSSDDAATKEYVDDVLASGYDAFAQATAAANSASQAASSASSASTSASNAATSETNAAGSASSAATSEANAASSAATAVSLLDSFDDRYLGAKASDPSTDNDGDPLLDGALYWNTTVSALRVYGGGVWNQFAYDPANVAITGGSAENLDTLTVNPNSSGNVARAVMSASSSGAAGEWLKLCTVNLGLSNYRRCTLAWNLEYPGDGGGGGSAEVRMHIGQTVAGFSAPSSVIEIANMHGIGPALVHNSIKAVSSGSAGDDIEIWLYAAGVVRALSVHEISAYIHSEISVTYHDQAVWDTATPTGAVEVTSAWGGSPWVTLSLQNGWTVSTGDALRYRRSADGTVVIQGYILAGTYNAPVNADALPVGYRPGRLLRFANTTGDTVTPGLARTYITDTGYIYCTGASGTSDLVAFELRYLAEN